MEMRCPNCGGDINVEVTSADNIKQSDIRPTSKSEFEFVKTKQPPRFPPTWGRYGSMEFDDVLNIDPEYMKECIANDNLFGTLKNNLINFAKEKGL